MRDETDDVQAFERRFGLPPRSRAEAPGRVNLIGDHTDYNDGFVLPTAIPQHTRVLVARGEGVHEAFSETLGEDARLDGSTRPEGFARYIDGCLKVLAERFGPLPTLKLWISSDVPVGAGLSSSAALEVSVLRAIDALLGLALGPVEIALIGRRAEVEHAGVNCGVMDQMASSLATPDRMLLIDSRSLGYELHPLPAGAEILVIDSGVRRSLRTSAYNQRLAECEAAAAALGLGSLRDADEGALSRIDALPAPLAARARHVTSENARVLAAVKSDAAGFGRLMNASHASLREDYEVVDATVDGIVSRLQAEPGVFGARMTGAGFGGACVALCRPGRAADIGRRVAAIVPGATVTVPPPDAPASR